jgi:IS4 transposase
MLAKEMLDRFCKESPLSVMVRAALEDTFSAPALDDLFAKTAERQVVGELAFSMVARLMSMVVLKTRKSMHAVYQAEKDAIGVAVKSVYNKLNGIEPRVSAELVRSTAARMEALVREMGGELPELIPGYPVRILDGNHLAATQHRIKELRTLRGGPLPGQSLVVLDPSLKLVLDVFPCEDGHTQERNILIDLAERLRAGELWIADRNFCTTFFLFELVLHAAFFLIRQHAANVRYEPIGQRSYAGRTATGKVYKQTVRILGDFGNEFLAGRVTIELDEPTVDGDTEIHLLTNLPESVSAVTIADTYRNRWTIEKAFNELTLSLRSEINTLGYPPAALFGFCMGLVLYNVLGVTQAALRAEHGHDKIEQTLSHYHVADEVSGVWRGMLIAIPEEQWADSYGSLSLVDMANVLRSLAKQVRLSRYVKHPRGPKKPPPNRTGGKKQAHVSTARILAERKLKE